MTSTSKPAAESITPPVRAGELSVDALNAGYGKIAVLHDVSLQVQAGESVALLGSNGAGKTTFLRTISGLMRPSSGSVMLSGKRINKASPVEIVRRGMAHVPQGRQVFAGMTVRENLLLGSRLRKDSAAVRSELEYILDVFPALAEKMKQRAGELSGGQQQALAIARALMSNPGILLLDEPSLGLAPRLVDDLIGLLRQVRADRGMSMLVVEQDTLLALELTERAHLLQHGRIVLTGRSSELASDPAIVHAYLGHDPGGSPAGEEPAG